MEVGDGHDRLDSIGPWSRCPAHRTLRALKTIEAQISYLFVKEGCKNWEQEISSEIDVVMGGTR
jgi:hypothetical protein